MDDPSRLVEGEASFETKVLGTWQMRQPSGAARMKTLAAVGVGGLVVAAPLATVGGGAAGGASASIAPKAVVLSASLLKWIGVGGAVATAAGVAGYATYSVTTTEPAPMTAAPVPLPVQISPVSPPRATPWVTASAAAPTVPPPLPAQSSSTATASNHPSTTPLRTSAQGPAQGNSLDDEVLAIDQARRALTAGNAASALELADAYDRRYADGSLGQESAEIRIEALFLAGKTAQGEKLGTRFLATYPASPYARVIRGLVTGARPPAP